jgi:hypothetical protein
LCNAPICVADPPGRREHCYDREFHCDGGERDSQRFRTDGGDRDGQRCSAPTPYTTKCEAGLSCNDKIGVADPPAVEKITTTVGDTYPSPTVTQLSSPSLLSPPDNPEGDAFLLVEDSRANRMTPLSKAVAAAPTLGVPMTTVNAFEALSVISSVKSMDTGDSSPPTPAEDTSSPPTPAADTTGRHDRAVDIDEIGVIAPTAFTSLQALVDNSYATYFGSGSALLPASTPLRLKEVFNEGARVLDRLLSEIQTEQHRHNARIDQRLQDIHAAQVDPQSLQSVEESLRAAMTTLERDTAQAFTPAITTLAEAAKENAKALNDLCTLTLPAMTAAAVTDNAKAIMDLTAATTANASALVELRQGLSACAAVKPIVDDLRYC